MKIPMKIPTNSPMEQQRFHQHRYSGGNSIIRVGKIEDCKYRYIGEDFTNKGGN
jgi:hypothetical protein